MGYDEHHPPAHTPGAISERGPATPWNHEDYEFPPSVGPVIFFILQILFLDYKLYYYSITEKYLWKNANYLRYAIFFSKRNNKWMKLMNSLKSAFLTKEQRICIMLLRAN